MTPARLLSLALAVTAAACSGCASSLTRLHFVDSRPTAERPATYLTLPLRTGQIVLSEAPGPYSLMFSLGPERHFDFTHAGILVMEDGAPFVYEMAGAYKLGFGERPTDGIEGTCQRVPLMDYCQAYLYVEIFDPPAGVDREKVGAWAQARHRDEIPFDAYFDYDEHERLFCTEFVQLALEAGGAPPVELIPIRQHPSLGKLLSWGGLESERCLPAGLFADPERSAAALGLLPTRTAAASYFAAKAELHRRFSDDQLLGNLFDMSGLADIEIRPAVLRYLQHSARLFNGRAQAPAHDVITAAVRSLAEQLFGAAEPPPESAAATTHELEEAR